MIKKNDNNPCAPARTWAAFYIEDKFKTLWSYRDKVIREHDPEMIHDMRVASRRLRAVLADFRSCIPKPHYKIVFRATKKLTEHLGCVRDMDILDERMTAMADDTSPGRMSAAVRFLHEKTAARRLKALERLAEFLSQLDNENYPQNIETLTGILRHG